MISKQQYTKKTKKNVTKAKQNIPNIKLSINFTKNNILSAYNSNQIR